MDKDINYLKEVELEPVELNKREIKRRKRAPTIKQIKAIQYINQGLSKPKAMIKAGYSKNTARIPKHKLMGKKGVQKIISDLGSELADSGLNAKYMVNKFKEWLESGEEEGRPNHHMQLEAYKEWKKVMDTDSEVGQTKGVKRKLTIEEFVNE